MKKDKAYRFEWQEFDENDCPLDNWGWDIVLAPNYTSAKKWIFETYCKDNNTKINYIAEIKYERPFNN